MLVVAILEWLADEAAQRLYNESADATHSPSWIDDESLQKVHDVNRTRPRFV